MPRTSRMDQLAAKYPPPPRVQNNTEPLRGIREETEPSFSNSNKEDETTAGRRRVNFGTANERCDSPPRPPPSEADPTRNGRGYMYNLLYDNVSVAKPFQDKSCVVDQSIMGGLAPNEHIIGATREVVTRIIEKSREIPAYSVTFKKIIKDLIKHITLKVDGKIISDFGELFSCLKKANCPKKKAAILHCLSLYPVLNRDEEIANVTWEAMSGWAREFATIITEEVRKIAVKLSEEGVTRENIKSKFVPLRNSIETRLRDCHRDSLGIFGRLGFISDTCLFLLFGLNITKSGNEIIFSDLIVRNIILTWMTKEEFPVQATSIRNVFWCLPFARITNLLGLGSVDMSVDDDMENVISLDEFLKDGIQLAG